MHEDLGRFRLKRYLTRICRRIDPELCPHIVEAWRFGLEALMLLLDTAVEFSETHDVIMKLLFAICDKPLSPNPVYYCLAFVYRENHDDLSGTQYLWNPEYN